MDFPSGSLFYDAPVMLPLYPSLPLLEVMRIDVVDNGGQWTHREWRVLRYLGLECDIIPNTTPVEQIVADGLVLSGGAPRIGSESSRLGNTGDFLDSLKIPLLGICVGCQFIAEHFGGLAGPASIPEYGETRLVVDEPGVLFKGLPSEFTVWESHNDEIKELTDDFVVLAHSKDCAYQAIKHKDRPIWGVQFHPEVEHTEHGSEIFHRFIEQC